MNTSQYRKYKILIILLLLSFSLQSCYVEKRIKESSYTDEWFSYHNQNYQVYKTKNGNRYIIVLNDRETRLKRKYID